jgi:hypothetical protein
MIDAGFTMDIEAPLRQLEFNYRAVLSAAVVAKTNYFARAGDPSALSAAVNRAKARWRQLDSRSALAARAVIFRTATKGRVTGVIKCRVRGDIP